MSRYTAEFDKRPPVLDLERDLPQYLHKTSEGRLEYVPRLQGMWVQPGIAVYDRRPEHLTLVVKSFDPFGDTLHIPLLPPDLNAERSIIDLGERALEVIEGAFPHVLDVIKKGHPDINAFHVKYGYMWHSTPALVLAHFLSSEGGYDVQNFFQLPYKKPAFNFSNFESGDRKQAGVLIIDRLPPR
jgi:hypothetical protein